MPTFKSMVPQLAREFKSLPRAYERDIAGWRLLAVQAMDDPILDRALKKLEFALVQELKALVHFQEEINALVEYYNL